MDFFTVSQVGDFISSIFRQEEFLHNIRIYGEVSGYKISKNHAYFTLKDDENQIQCSCFDYAKTYSPRDGEAVIIKGSPNYYSKGGKLSFVVDYIEPVGKGLLYIQLEQLKKKLESEGLFDEIHKKKLPLYCENIGVITSKTGAVIRDICTTIRKYNANINIILNDARVQGIGAVEELVGGIEELDKLKLDAIIIARGGGSFEDLMPFNDERLARAIYNAKTPIISAVGHETDFSVCDFVADYRCATPTASGELVAYSQTDVKKTVEEKIIRAKNCLQKKIEEKNTELSAIASVLEAVIDTKYEYAKRKVYYASISAKHAAKVKIHNILYRYMEYNNSLKRAEKGILNRREIYIKKDGKIVSDLNGVEKGDNIEIISGRIVLGARITNKEVGNEQ